MALQIQSGEPVSCRVANLDFLVNLEISGNISDLRLDNAYVFIDRQALNHPEKARQLIVKSMLQRWPISDENRFRIADIAMFTIFKSLKRMPRKLNFFAFRLHVSDYVLDLHGVHMVPATEESIGNLERKKPRVEVEDSGCPVCLEDFSLDCQVFHMPCSHGFHGDCIKKWLRKSHYCPLCRFEMPTNHHQFIISNDIVRYNFV